MKTRCLVVAPGATTISVVDPGHNSHAALELIGHRLSAAEERLEALALRTQRVDAHLQSVREIRALVATLARNEEPAPLGR